MCPTVLYSTSLKLVVGRPYVVYVAPSMMQHFNVPSTEYELFDIFALDTKVYYKSKNETSRILSLM